MCIQNIGEKVRKQTTLFYKSIGITVKFKNINIFKKYLIWLQNQNQNSLLVTRQIDIISPGGSDGGGEN